MGEVCSFLTSSAHKQIICSVLLTEHLPNNLCETVQVRRLSSYILFAFVKKGPMGGTNVPVRKPPYTVQLQKQVIVPFGGHLYSSFSPEIPTWRQQQCLLMAEWTDCGIKLTQ